MEGFEPPNAGTRNQSLTTWRHPNISITIITYKAKKIAPYKLYIDIYDFSISSTVKMYNIFSVTKMLNVHKLFFQEFIDIKPMF